MYDLENSYDYDNWTLAERTAIRWSFVSSSTLSLFDLGLSIACILSLVLPLSGPEQLETTFQNVTCVIEGVSIQYFQLSSFLWTSCMAWHSYCTWVREEPPELLESKFKWYAVISWGLCAIPPIALLAEGAIGPVEGVTWCWIKRQWPIVRLCVLYLPTLILWIFSLVCYVLVRRKIVTSLSFLESQVNTRVTGYVCVFVVTSMVPLLNRFLLAFGEVVYTMFLLHALLDPSIGFLNAIIYGVTNPKMKQQVSFFISFLFSLFSFLFFFLFSRLHALLGLSIGFLNAIIYGVTNPKMKQQVSSLRRSSRFSLLYLVCSFVLFPFGFVSRNFLVFLSVFLSFLFPLCHALLDPSIVFLNAIIYGVTKMKQRLCSDYERLEDDREPSMVKTEANDTTPLPPKGPLNYR